MNTFENNFSSLTIFLILLLQGSSLMLSGQEIISLKNPSFESDLPNINTIPNAWGSFSGNVAGYPDLLPGEYVINAIPKEGKTFVGLRARQSDIYEGLGQQLTTPLLMDSVYQINVWLAHASKYLVPKFKKGKQNGTVSCNGTTKLRVLGVNSKTQKQELLAESPEIDHPDWRNYSLTLYPQLMDCDQIFLTAYYTLGDFKKEGNLLVDHCSEIKKVSWSSPGRFSETGISQSTTLAVSQADKILLNNPSFDALPEKARNTIKFWDNLGPENQSPPDIQPGQYAVITKPSHGNQYLGMVVRETGTREAIGQKLPAILAKKTAYSFQLWMARSEDYTSMTRVGERSFSTPAVLQIWGLNTQTSKKVLLAKSDPVAHENWRQYDFTLMSPEFDVDYIILEAWFDLKNNKAYNGNILIDNCSAIVRLNK